MNINLYKMKKNSFKTQLFFSFFMQMMNYLTPLLVAPYISRILLDVGVGEYSYAYSITAYFTLIISFGFDGYGNREISLNRYSEATVRNIFWNILTTKFVLFIISLIAYLYITLNTILTNGVSINIYFALIPVLFGCLIDINFYYYATERVSYMSIITSFVNLMYMFCIFNFVKDINDLFLYTLFKSSIYVVIFMFEWLIIFKEVKVVDVKKISVLNTIKNAFPYFLPALIAVFANMLAQTMLGIFSSNTQVGYFQQAFKIISLALSLINCLNPIVLSKISYLSGSNLQNEIISKFIRSFQLILFIGLPSVVGLFCVSRFFIPMFYGEVFTPVVSVTILLAPTIVLSPLASLWMNSIFYPLGKANYASVGMLIGNIINIILNFLLIDSYKANGVALSTSISSLCIFLIYIYISRSLLSIKGLLFKNIKKTLLASIVMGIILLIFQFVIQRLGLSYLLITLCSGVVGFFVYIFVLFIIKDDFLFYVIEYTKNIILRKK